MSCKTNLNRVFCLIVGAILSLNTLIAQADKETGYFRVGIVGGSWPFSDIVALENKTAVPGGTGRCSAVTYGGFVGNGTLGAALTGDRAESSKAIYSLLLAANLAGKQVTVEYTYSTTSNYAFNCYLNDVTINN